MQFKQEEKINTILFKSLGADDKNEVLAHYVNLSQEDKRFRFMSTISDENIQPFINSLDKTELSSNRLFGAFSVSNRQKTKPTLIGVAHISIIDDAKKVTEVALSVDAQYRRLGIGMGLINQAIAYTQEMGCLTLTMSCSGSNTPMLSLARRSGFHIKYGELSDFEGSLNVKRIDMNPVSD